jgi:hypothetical protein
MLYIIRLFTVACCAVAAFSSTPAIAEESALKPGDTFKECDVCPALPSKQRDQFVGALASIIATLERPVAA